MINYYISDLVARINNAKLAKTSNVKIPATKDTLAILKILEKEGFLTILDIVKNTNNSMTTLLISINWNSIDMIKVVSKPGRRIYRGWKDMHDSSSYLCLLRTSKGILPSHEAIVKKLGGEVLLKISPS